MILFPTILYSHFNHYFQIHTFVFKVRRLQIIAIIFKVSGVYLREFCSYQHTFISIIAYKLSMKGKENIQFGLIDMNGQSFI